MRKNIRHKTERHQKEAPGYINRRSETFKKRFGHDAVSTRNEYDCAHVATANASKMLGGIGGPCLEYPSLVNLVPPRKDVGTAMPLLAERLSALPEPWQLTDAINRLNIKRKGSRLWQLFQCHEGSFVCIFRLTPKDKESGLHGSFHAVVCHFVSLFHISLSWLIIMFLQAYDGRSVVDDRARSNWRELQMHDRLTHQSATTVMESFTLNKDGTSDMEWDLSSVWSLDRI